ncbi:MAG: nucleotide exchange factor GrpE [Chloroflexi bacterium]|nr:nucleotide exchange factor GrpE [Chloroflexota bacterium]
MSEIEDKIPQEDPTESGQITDSDEIKNFTEKSNDELAEALREKEQFKRLAQRAQADLVNYRRRIDGEQESSRQRNLQRVVLKFADVIDQLDVALNSNSIKDADPGWLEGVTAIQKNFMNTVASEGFERFISVGEQFDPRNHEALLSSPTADHEANTVITELRPGYMYNGEVVRPAQVEIAISLLENDLKDESNGNG